MPETITADQPFEWYTLKLAKMTTTDLHALLYQTGPRPAAAQMRAIRAELKSREI